MIWINVITGVVLWPPVGVIWLVHIGRSWMRWMRSRVKFRVWIMVPGIVGRHA